MPTSKQRQIYYLRKKIEKLITNYHTIFLTLTFNTKTIENTNEKTRERYIKDYLKKETAFYILNKDYGKETEREHYHALIIPSTLTKEDLNKIDYSYSIRLNIHRYKYGIITAKKILKLKNYPKDIIKNNVDALTNHFIKETTKGARIIQSRKIPTKQEQLKRIKRFKFDIAKYTNNNNERLTISQKIKLSKEDKNDLKYLEEEINEIERYNRYYNGK